ncbi:MAG TPA: roadblock/LC7 domain-containing protein [Gemmatimonadales bacterium]|nr:roadblock/LC7 domain-containing protein [Gemmatimonadales bacterium]
MHTLAEVLRALAGRPGVNAVVLVSPDGLPIERAGRDAGDADALAALAATALRHALRLADGAGTGDLGTLLLEGSHGTLLLSPAGPSGWLLARVAPDADFGDLLFDLRTHQPALAALL